MDYNKKLIRQYRKEHPQLDEFIKYLNSNQYIHRLYDDEYNFVQILSHLLRRGSIKAVEYIITNMKFNRKNIRKISSNILLIELILQIHGRIIKFFDKNTVYLVDFLAMCLYLVPSEDFISLVCHLDELHIDLNMQDIQGLYLYDHYVRRAKILNSDYNLLRPKWSISTHKYASDLHKEIVKTIIILQNCSIWALLPIELIEQILKYRL